jgi:hypothetical protein
MNDAIYENIVKIHSLLILVIHLSDQVEAVKTGLENAFEQ